MYIDPLQTFCVITEGIVSYLGFIIVSKYIFFEKGVLGKEQFTFHLIALFGILMASISGGSFSASVGGGALADFVPKFVMIMGFLWIFYGREERKFTGILLAIPILGIVDGLFVPFVFLPGLVLNVKHDSLIILKIILQALIIIVLALMIKTLAKREELFKNKILHEFANTNLSNGKSRNLSTLERGLLCFVGCFELFFSTLIGKSTIIKADMWFTGLAISKQDYITILYGISTFVLTIIVIIVVVSGNKRIYYSDKISDMQFNIIVMMAEIVENRDENTGGHIQRTAKYVEIIAENLKRGPYKDYMTDSYINDIKIAAPLHDIGKIHVSDLILNKPGKLTSEEFEIMKTHASEGRKLLTQAKQHLGDFSYLDIAIDMASYHHEWWDGSVKGYPEQISGEDIPLCARIMAVADVFDALTAKRCYKEAIPIKKAIKIIKSESGTHFDPLVVDAFLLSMDKIEAAFKEFENSRIDNEDD